MTEKKKLFKDEYYNKKKESIRSKWYVYLVALYIKVNTVIMWFTIVLNALLIVYMLNNFNAGIVLFLSNQYIVVRYYMKVRRERQEKREEKLQVI